MSAYNECENTLIVNRLNSGTLFVVNGISDGAAVGCVRYNNWDKNRRHRWTTRKVGEEKGYNVMTIEIADGDKVFCLDAGDAEISSSTPIRIRERDGSDRQKWYFRPDWITHSDDKLINPIPYLNWGAALSLSDAFDAEWRNTVLDRSFSAVSQEWYLNTAHYHDEIPN